MVRAGLPIRAALKHPLSHEPFLTGFSTLAGYADTPPVPSHLSHEQTMKRITLLLACFLLPAGFGSDSVQKLPGNWLIPKARSVQATQVARFELVSVAESPPEASFTRITGLGVDSGGQIFVGDFGSDRVHVLSADGSPLATVGRRGKGPGEFRSITNVQVLPGDSLLVFDRDLARVTIFAPQTYDVASTTLLSTPEIPATPYWVEAVGDGLLLAAYRQSFRPSDAPEDDKKRFETVRLLGREGSVVRDSFLHVPSRQFLVARNNSRVSVAPHPFGRRALLAHGPRGRIYFALTDAAHVHIFEQSGREESSIRLHRSPIPITREDLWTARADIGEVFQDLLTTETIDTWPPLQSLLVDDRGMIWLGITTPSGEPTEWAVFNGNGDYLGSAYVDDSIQLLHIAGRNAYGVRTGPFDVPVVVVFTIEGIEESGDGGA